MADVRARHPRNRAFRRRSHQPLAMAASSRAVASGFDAVVEPRREIDAAERVRAIERSAARYLRLSVLTYREQ